MTVGIPGTKRPEADYPSAELVRDFLYYTADLRVEEAATLAGVSTATLTRWRMMGARQLRADVRSRLLRFLERRQKEQRSVSRAA